MQDSLSVTRVSVKVERDHLEKLVRPSRRLAGITELVWNGFDAEASHVTVDVVENALGGIDEVQVRDDGHGMTHEQAIHDFELLGGSWKRTAEYSKNHKRLLHGSEGEGRWRGFSIGDRLRWHTVSESEDGRHATEIIGTRSALSQFDISDAQPTDDPAGTLVIVDNVRADQIPQLSGETAIDVLAAEFALYLEEYPDVELRYRKQQVSPSSYQAHRADYPLRMTTDDGDVYLTVIEWTRPFERALYLCDSNGMALAEIAPGIQAPGFDFTAYLKWEGFRAHESELALAELGNPVLTPIIDAAKDQLREHFKLRATETQRALIQRWKAEDAYPYTGEPTGSVERAERDLFEVVALAAAPVVNDSELAGRRLSLRLLKEAIEQNPTSLHRVLQEVLELPQDRLAELEQLLARTSLSSIIAAAKIVTDRLDFLKGLELLLFEAANKKALLERSQLHRILAEESWVFGEEYNLSVDDQSLTEVLKKHIEILGRHDVAPDEPVVDGEGRAAIVDLMLSRVIPQARNRREHLVVELKRPSVKLGAKEITQIKTYAYAVADDERFSRTETAWDFVLVSNELSKFAEREASQSDREFGLIHDDHGVRVWVKTWAQLIEDSDHRLKFVQQNLDYESTREHAIAYLRQAHERYLPDTLDEG